MRKRVKLVSSSGGMFTDLLGTNWGQGWQGKPNLVTMQSTRRFFVSNTLEGTCSTLPTQRQSKHNPL